MDPVPERVEFPEVEEEILQYWTKIDAFKTSLKKSEGRPPYTFYDGPPFATGLPHYGHILAGTIKDIVTRYAHQTGHYVSRRFGWDCHGLPIEFEIDKQYGIKTKDDVLKWGIPQYNAACRSIVMRYSSEWEVIVNRLGRWIDFKNDYKTLDTNFMESVWWVFYKIWKKGLVYRGFKVMPYSTACTTPLSNFEVNGDVYKDVVDPAVIVRFPLVEDNNVSLIAWTTTPWTLPSNLALCVNPDLDYIKLQDLKTKQTYILMEARIKELYKAEDEYKILEKFKGATLKGKAYLPIFDYFTKVVKNAWFVVCDDYVTAESGTGVVHCAPAFGEDDYRVCMNAGIISRGEDLVCPVDASGRFTSEVSDWQGIHVKEADSGIIKKLKEIGRLVHRSDYKHSYPFCWRSDTPLIYKAVPSWFIHVEKIKDQLLVNNKKSYWVPEFVQEKRFHNWLQDARDWSVSRNRYWGTPLPIWVSDDGKEVVVVKSIQKLKELSGVTVTDLHRENVDHITIPSQQGKGVLRRVEEVFDCWFESGSMPYAQVHYPFENKEAFKKSFPADFIAEGIDQTRGWFYTLLVISTILYNEPPFKNLIVNGLVLASDGRKMSKRLKNYPDPMNIVNSYGADALRLYLINSPVVRADFLKFQEKGVRDVVKDVFLPWFNAYRFFTEAVVKYNKQGQKFKPNTATALASTNVTDKWILAATNSLIKFVRAEMQAYRLYTVIPQLVQFIEQLTNWFIKLNRKRLKGSEGQSDANVALCTLFEVLFTVVKAMSPFTPFLTEYFYQNLRKLFDESEDSVHYLFFPEPIESALNEEIEQAVKAMQSVIQLGRTARDKRNKPVKLPLSQVTVIHKDAQFLKKIEVLLPYIEQELNVKKVVLTTDQSSLVTNAKPDFKLLGPKVKDKISQLKTAIQNLSHEQIQTFLSKGSIELLGITITSDEMKISREYKGDVKQNEAAWDENITIVLDVCPDQSLIEEGTAREIINRVQRLRKKAGVRPTDPIEVFYQLNQNSSLKKVFENREALITSTLGVAVVPTEHKPASSVVLMKETAQVGSEKFEILLCRLAFAVSPAARSKVPSDEFFADLKTVVATRDYFTLLKTLQEKGSVTFLLNDQSVQLQFNRDIFASSHSLLQDGNKN